MIGRSHQNLKQIVKINVANDAPQWDRYFNLAVMAHNTTYHQTLKCLPSETFHGRLPCNALDFEFGHPLQQPRGTTDIKPLVDQVNQIYIANVDNIFSACFKSKEYYNRKAQASLLEVGDYVFLLNPKYNSQSDKTQFKTFL